MLDPDENFIDSFIDEVYFDDLVVEKDFADVKYFAIIRNIIDLYLIYSLHIIYN